MKPTLLGAHYRSWFDPKPSELQRDLNLIFDALALADEKRTTAQAIKAIENIHEWCDYGEYL